MSIGAFVPLACFVLILGGVGVRLVALWRKTGQIPEMTLGFGLLIVCSSMPLSAVGRVPAVALEPIGRICFSIGLLLAAVGISLIVYFNYWVFRRGSSWWPSCQVMGLERVPMSVISTSTVSPGCIQSWGWRREPTPPGVPVAMTSPGNSSVNEDT